MGVGPPCPLNNIIFQDQLPPLNIGVSRKLNRWNYLVLKLHYVAILYIFGKHVQLQKKNNVPNLCHLQACRYSLSSFWLRLYMTPQLSLIGGPKPMLHFAKSDFENSPKTPFSFNLSFFGFTMVIRHFSWKFWEKNTIIGFWGILKLRFFENRFL